MMRHLKFILMFFVVAALAVSCSSNDEPAQYELRAADGRTIYVSSSVQQYNTESDLIDVLCQIDLPEASTTTGTRSEVTVERDSLYGYTSVPYLLNNVWQRVRLGSWCEGYGLETGKIYLMNFKQVTRYIPCAYDETIVCVTYPQEARNMGACNGSIGYVLGNENVGGKFNAYTAVAVIGYDADGNVIETHFPCEPEDLLWKYFVATWF